MLRDFNLEWLRKRIYIPVNGFSGLGGVNNLTVNSGVTAVTSSAANGAIISGTGQIGSNLSGNRALTNVNASGISGLLFSATTDLVSHLFMAPYDLDINKEVTFRVHSVSGVTTGTMSWAVTYALLNAPANADLVATGSSGTTPGATTLGTVAAFTYNALDTTVPAVAVPATAYTYSVSDYGIIKRASSAAVPLKTSTYAIALQVGIGGTVPATTYLLGIEIRYTMRKTVGPRRNVIGGRRLAEPLGVQWTNSKQEGL